MELELLAQDMEVYGVGGSATTAGPNGLRTQFKGSKEEVSATAPALPESRSDSLACLIAVLRGQLDPKGDLSSLDTNMVVMQILDAARTSAATGRTIDLKPLQY